MSLAHRIRTVFCCACLQLGALLGVPMRPEEIQDLMHRLNKSKVAHTNPEKAPDGPNARAGKSDAASRDREPDGPRGLRSRERHAGR
jgi:hypothetical protein